MLQLAIYDSPSLGTLLLDASARASGLTFATNEHGFESLRANIRLTLAEAYWLHDWPGLPHVALFDPAAGVVWEGRLEDRSITDGGAALTALGYWRALSDVPYTALWSDMTVGAWQTKPTEEHAGYAPERYQMDTNNRLYVAPTKSSVLGTTGTTKAGGWRYKAPAGSSRTLTYLSLTYTLVAPANWLAVVYCYDGSGAYLGTPWSLGGNGGTQSAPTTVTLTAGTREVVLALYYNAADAAYAGETGATYLRATNLRLSSVPAGAATVSAAAIAADLAAAVNAINPLQLSASSALLVSPGLDLTDEIYEDQAPADILTHLAGLGDTQTPPGQWETGVWEDRTLHFRPRGSAGRSWYVDAASLEVERSLDGLRNAAYGVYRDAAGVTQRTAATVDSASVARYGLTRRTSVSANTTSATQAGVQRDAYLDDHKALQPRAGLTIGALYDAAGGRWPLWAARAGDSMTIRNLSPVLSTDVDKIRTFRLAHTEYHCDNDTLTLEPESPLPSLEMLLNRRDEGIKEKR